MKKFSQSKFLAGKIVMVIMYAGITGCGVTKYQAYQSIIESIESTEPRYKLSDIDAQHWIIESNKVEQCLFYNEWKNHNFYNLSKEEKDLLNYFVNLKTLIRLIGEDSFKIIQLDKKSQEYADFKFRKFNHSEPVIFDNTWCQSLKSEYAISLNKLRAQIKAQREQEKAKQQQAEKERIAREAFLATPQGQAYLAQQQMIARQQAMQYQQQQMLQQQMAAQAQLERQQAWQDLNNSIQQSTQSLTNTLNNNTQMINNTNHQMMMRNNQMMQNWAPNNGTIDCYRLGDGIARCNY